MRAALALLALLAGCGGGGGGSGSGSAPLSTVAVAPAPEPDAVPPAKAVDCSLALWGDSISAGHYFGGTLSVRPAAALQARGFVVTDNAQDGASAGAMTAVALADPMDERFQVIAYGANDAGNGFAYEAPLRSLVARAQSLGRVAVITGLSRGGIPNRDAYDAIARSVAASTGARFADWGAADWRAEDMADAVHPGQAYSLRLVERIAAVMPECSK